MKRGMFYSYMFLALCGAGMFGFELIIRRSPGIFGLYILSVGMAVSLHYLHCCRDDVPEIKTGHVNLLRLSYIAHGVAAACFVAGFIYIMLFSPGGE